MDGVGVRFGRRVALRGVDLMIGSGVTAVIGLNGAGKSTLLRCAAGLLSPSDGHVSWDGRRDVGFAPQDTPVTRTLRVESYLAYLALLSGAGRAQALGQAASAAARVGLSGERTTRTNQLSGGMRKRLGIACSLLGDPAALLLDEPTAGLDPVQRRGVIELIRSLGVAHSVVLSTHLADDVRSCADRLVVLVEGRLALDTSFPVDSDGSVAARPLLVDLGLAGESAT